ncbi:MAG: hypothetical protein IJ193_04465 [Bacilli bacterium]|nr:hypothetical protein [Bacilli bacterium]
MKKSLFGILVLVAVAFMSVTNVSAMTEAELRTHVKSSYTVGGTTVTVPAEYIKQFEDYLDAFEISSEDCQYIADQLDYLRNVAQNNGVKSASEFEQKCAAEIKAAVSRVSANTGVKATVLSNGKLQVSKYNKPNETFVVAGTNIATNTGSASLLYIAGIITALGATLLVFRVRKA